MAREQIEQMVFGLGRGMAEDAVVVGSGVIDLTIDGARGPRDTDVALPRGAFEYLRAQGGWEEIVGDDGEVSVIRRPGLDVGIGWGGTADYEGLRARSWQTGSGLRVAGLPDVYAYKQRRRSDGDMQDMQTIRDRLQGPDSSPLAARFIPHEVAAARACLPEELQDDPEAELAVLLAANGLHIVRTLYGHPQIDQANQIVGDLERPEFNVPATYHNGFGLEQDAMRLQAHMRNIGAPAHDRRLALAIDPYTDAFYGNGRFKNNPQGHDELRSAQLLRSHAQQLGFEADADRMHDVVLDTTFDEEAKTQRGTKSADPLARGVVGVDLDPLARPEIVATSFDVAVEDLFSARFSPARTIGRILTERGERVYSTAQALELIDRYAHERPADAPDGPTAMQAFAARLAGNAGFIRSHQYPHDWTLDDPAERARSADKLEAISAELLAGQMAVDAYAELA